MVADELTSPPGWIGTATRCWRLHGTDRHLIGARHLYFAGDAALQPEGASLLSAMRPGEWLGGGTFRNSCYLDPWRQLTTAQDLRLVVDLQGDAQVRVMCAVAGRAADALMEFRVRSPVRGARAYALPRAAELPAGARLYWHIDAHAATHLHDVAFATATPPPCQPRLAVLMRTYGRTAELTALLHSFLRSAAASPWYAWCLSRMDFWLLDASDAPPVPHLGLPAGALNLRVMRGPNLGGGGNASLLIERYLSESDAADASAPSEVLILDDDLLISFESLARYLALCSYRAKDAIVSLPILMQSQPTTVWEDGGIWGRYNAAGSDGLGRTRSFFPTLLKHGTSLDGYERLDDFGRYNEAEYSTFVFFGLPRRTLERIGLPVAFFLRGDDIELSLRAQRGGVPLITNPNLAAWHEPGHSHAQEYMAILHAAIINLTYSDNDAACYVRYFEERLYEHAALGDLLGLEVYLAVVEALADPESKCLTPEFAAHYVAMIKRCGAAGAQRMPELERARLDERTRAAGGQLLPFLYAGYQRPDPARGPVLLVNHSRGEYRELAPAAFAAKASLMSRFIAALSRFEGEFDALRLHWQQRLQASGTRAYWAAVAAAYADAIAEISRMACDDVAPVHAAPLLEANLPPAASGGGAIFASHTAAPEPAPMPLRELQQRVAEQLAALQRLNAQGGHAPAGAAQRGSARGALPRNGWLSWLGRRDARKPAAKQTLAVLPPDFEPDQYLALNADVARTGIDAAQHYLRYGHAEGRRYRRGAAAELSPALRKA